MEKEQVLLSSSYRWGNKAWKKSKTSQLANGRDGIRTYICLIPVLTPLDHAIYSSITFIQIIRSLLWSLNWQETNWNNWVFLFISFFSVHTFLYMFGFAHEYAHLHMYRKKPDNIFWYITFYKCNISPNFFPWSSPRFFL